MRYKIGSDRRTSSMLGKHHDAEGSLQRDGVDGDGDIHTPLPPLCSSETLTLSVGGGESSYSPRAWIKVPKVPGTAVCVCGLLGPPRGTPGHRGFRGGSDGHPPCPGVA